MSERYDKTFIGIDYGERRIGLAKSDPTGLIASTLKTLEVISPRDAIRQLVKVIREYTPNGLVIGYPVNLEGKKTQKCLEIDRFIIKLQSAYSGPIHREDERHSSEDAADIIHKHGKRTGRDKGRIDRLAAVVFLQHFLDDLPRE